MSGGVNTVYTAPTNLSPREKARENVSKAINNELLFAYWNIGKRIVEYEQGEVEKAEYGKQLLKTLSKELTKELGKGFSRSNLQNMRLLYLNYPICQSLSGKLSFTHYCELFTVSDKNAREVRASLQC